MAAENVNPVLRLVRRIAARDSADAQLLRRFVSDRDEAAFEAIVRRHGGMVLGVCRRVLRDPHDVEDAFQSTFLVLVRKADSISKPELLGNWLYGAAYRTCQKAKSEIARRRERPLEDLPAPDLPCEAGSAEAAAVIDEEINRLPTKYQEAFVLCCLEGKTGAEAAQVLSCPVGTVLSRLSRAREKLRVRLTRRGLALPAASFALMFQEALAPAAVPPALVSSTAKAATLFTVGKALPAGVVSVQVIALTQGVLKAMLMTKVKIATAVLLSVGLIGAGAGRMVYTRGLEPDAAQVADAEPAQRLAEPAKEEKNRAALKPLLDKRLEWAQKEHDALQRDFMAGRIPVSSLDGAALRLLKAKVELSEKKAERIKAYEAYLKQIFESAQISKAQHDAGRLFDADYFKAEYNLAEAEIWLEREKAR